MLPFSNSIEKSTPQKSHFLSSPNTNETPTVPLLTCEASKDSEGSTREETPFSKLCYALSPLMTRASRFQARQPAEDEISPFDVNFSNDEPEIVEKAPSEMSSIEELDEKISVPENLEIVQPLEDQKEGSAATDQPLFEPLSENLTTPSLGGSQILRGFIEDSELRVCLPEPADTNSVKAVISGSLFNTKREKVPLNLRTNLKCSETLLLENEIPVRVKRQKI